MLDQLLAPRNLFVIWLLFPVIKLLHELGHGFVTKRFGGEFTSSLTPVPYVEASAAWAFPASGIVVSNPRLGLVRTRAMATSTVLATAVVGLICVVQALPYHGRGCRLDPG